MIPKFSPKRKMLSNEIPRSAELEDGSKASSPRRLCPSPSQRRQLDNFIYSEDGELADRRCGSSAGPLPPRQCAKLTSKSRVTAALADSWDDYVDGEICITLRTPVCEDHWPSSNPPTLTD